MSLLQDRCCHGNLEKYPVFLRNYLMSQLESLVKHLFYIFLRDIALCKRIHHSSHFLLLLLMKCIQDRENGENISGVNLLRRAHDLFCHSGTSLPLSMNS